MATASQLRVRHLVSQRDSFGCGPIAGFHVLRHLMPDKLASNSITLRDVYHWCDVRHWGVLVKTLRDTIHDIALECGTKLASIGSPTWATIHAHVTIAQQAAVVLVVKPGETDGHFVAVLPTGSSAYIMANVMTKPGARVMYRHWRVSTSAWPLGSDMTFKTGIMFWQEHKLAKRR